jgi:hypothetical protein
MLSFNNLLPATALGPVVFRLCILLALQVGFIKIAKVNLASALRVSAFSFVCHCGGIVEW